MHAEGKKVTQTRKTADNEREGVLYLNSRSKRHNMYSNFKIEASSFFVKLIHHVDQHQAELVKKSGNRKQFKNTLKTIVARSGAKINTFKIFTVYFGTFVLRYKAKKDIKT
jgi:hypothetical protein